MAKGKMFLTDERTAGVNEKNNVTDIRRKKEPVKKNFRTRGRPHIARAGCLR
ncbi:MAG: hypothetical protein V1804_01290 [Patescibacteria group bacterium]